MTTSAGTQDTAAVKRVHGLRTNVARTTVAVRPVRRTDLTHHDGCAHHPTRLRQRRAGHVAGLCLRHCHAALRRVVPEPVRQAIGVRWLHVRLHGQGARAQHGGLLGLDPHLGLLLHRRGGHVRVRGLLRPIALRTRLPRVGTPDHLLRYQRAGLLGDRLQRHPGVHHPHAGPRVRLGRLHHRAGVRDPVQARLQGRHHAALLGRRQRAGHGPGRCRLHLLARRLRGGDDNGVGGEESAAQPAPCRDRQSAHHGLVHGLHGLRRGRGARATTAAPGPRLRSITWRRPMG